jgi:hypothetical protein
VGHRDPSTTAIYAAYASNKEEVAMAGRAFANPLSSRRLHMPAA